MGVFLSSRSRGGGGFDIRDAGEYFTFARGGGVPPLSFIYLFIFEKRMQIIIMHSESMYSRLVVEFSLLS